MKIALPSSSNAASQAGFFAAAALNFVATVHLVWFYLSVIPCYLNLPRYEQGLEKTPFQHRILLMLPLRWAHNSIFFKHLAYRLTAMPAWFPGGVRPEGILQAVIDLTAVIVTGLITRAIYRASSPRQMLTPFVYPLTLVMILCTYVLNTMHRLRFIYDLPSLGFFALGMYLIYFRKPSIWFVSLFLIATINRETTLFLLPMYLLAEIVPEQAGAAVYWHGLTRPRVWAVTLPLSVFWFAWHVYVAHRFAANPSVAISRVWLNLGILLWPTSWPQLLGTFAFCTPLVLVYRREVRDRTLRLWQWIPLLWLLFMFHYGIFVETRIFGEMIPLIACSALLLAEERIARRTATSEYAIAGLAG